jgi:hypothetical protein
VRLSEWIGRRPGNDAGMSLALILIIIGVILMVLGSCGVAFGRCDLYRLGWAFVVTGALVVGKVS